MEVVSHVSCGVEVAARHLVLLLGELSPRGLYYPDFGVVAGLAMLGGTAPKSPRCREKGSSPGGRQPPAKNRRYIQKGKGGAP
jgi:hypothetical protein